MENCKILWGNTEEYQFKRYNHITTYFFSNVKIKNTEEIKSLKFLSVNSKFQNFII